MMTPAGATQGIPWVKFKNNSGEQIPAGGIIRLTGFTADAEESYYLGAKPNAFGAQYSHAINGILPVGAGKYGYCYLGQTVPALYESSDGTPAFGESWGPRDATWKLKKDTGGFRVLGVTDSTRKFVLVTPAPMLQGNGVADEDIAEGASGDVLISSVAVEMHATYGDVTDGADVWWAWDELEQRYSVIQQPCA